MDDKTSKFAQRLKDKLSGSKDPAHTDEAAGELIDSQLEAVSGGTSGHASHSSVIVDPNAAEEGKQ